MEYIVLGDNDVAVPPEFFKAVAVFYDDDDGNEEVRFHGWIMENRSGSRMRLFILFNSQRTTFQVQVV